MLNYHLEYLVTFTNNLYRSNLINLQSLCIFEKKAAWVLYADIICLNYDGSAFDYAWAALFAALKTVKLPTAVWDEDLERVICASTLTRPVQLNTEVRSFSWSVFDDKLLADPTDEEEDLSTEFLTIMLNSSKNIVKIIKLGGTHIQPLLLKKCIEVARSKF